MKKFDVLCPVCESEINEYDYYISGDKRIVFCSEECVKTVLPNAFMVDGIYNIKTCRGHDYCKKLGNTREICVFTKEINEELFNPMRIPKKTDYPNWCSPAEVSIIVGNMKLLDFVKKSEEKSTKLNKETLKQSKLTNRLTWIMLVVSLVNLLLLIFSN